jgi:hypothetical protein
LLHGPLPARPNYGDNKHPIRILDTKERNTRRATVKMFNIQWNHHTEEEATWETENYLLKNFPDFLKIS